jgi:hypothetical protein
MPQWLSGVHFHVLELARPRPASTKRHLFRDQRDSLPFALMAGWVSNAFSIESTIESESPAMTKWRWLPKPGGPLNQSLYWKSNLAFRAGRSGLGTDSLPNDLKG